MDQSYSSSQLKKLFKEIELDFIKVSKSDFLKTIDTNFENLSRLDFEFNFKQIEGNVVLEKKELAQKLVLRKLNSNIKRIYKDEQANRKVIIAQIKALMEETCPFWILKTDIKNFYESINRERIFERLKDDAMLSYHSLYILKQIFENRVVENLKGLPRGVNVSSTLSEFYMRKFDRWARQYPGVYYYARFVDDIIIFANSKKVISEMQDLINEKLELYSKGLKKNEAKTAIYEGQKIDKDKSLNYLGYKFYKSDLLIVEKRHLEIKKKNNIISDLSYQPANEDLIVCDSSDIDIISYHVQESKRTRGALNISISENKVNKFKSRIVKSFVEFVKDEDFLLLQNRIKFLTGNYPIRKNAEGKELKAGIYYNYLQINDLSVLKELDVFFRKILFSKNNSLGSKINSRLNSEQKNSLKKYSFISGFKNQIYYSFQSNEMSEIVKCW